MANYTKVGWVNGGAPPLNAENLNHMDDGIAQLDVGKLDDSDSVVQSNHISSGAVTNEKLSLNSVKYYNIEDEAININKLGGKSVSLEKLADETRAYIDSKIANEDGTVSTNNLADKSVTSPKVADKSILARHLYGIDNEPVGGSTNLIYSTAVYKAVDDLKKAVDTALSAKQDLDKLITQFDALFTDDTDSKYPTVNAVVNYLKEYFYDANETDELLGDKINNSAGSVGTENIADSAVTESKIAKSSVSSDKLALNAVTNKNLADGAVTMEKISSAYIDNAPSIAAPFYGECLVKSGGVYNALQKKANDRIVFGEEYKDLTLTENEGAFINDTTGNPNMSTAYKYTDKIACSSDDKFLVSTSYGYHSPVAVFYDSSDVYIGYFGLSASSSVSCTDLSLDVANDDIYAADGTAITDEQRSSIAYIAFNGKVDTTLAVKKHVNNVYKISEIFEMLFNKGVANSMIADKAITADKISDDLMSSVRNNNTLYGKSLFVAGDSVAQGQGSGGYAFGEWLRDRNNMTLTKDAIGGTTIGICPSQSNPSIYERICLTHTINGTEYPPLSGSYDYIIIEGGFNDVFKATSDFTLGEISDSYDGTYVKTSDTEVDTTKTYYTMDATPTTHPRRFREVTSPVADKLSVYYELVDFDPNTTLGALELICRYLTLNYFDTKKLFVLGHRKVDAFAVRQETYWNAMIEVLNKWGIPYVDVRRETNLFALNESFGTQYFAEAAGTHPLKETYLKFYVPLIEAKLNGANGSDYILTETDKTEIANIVINDIDNSIMGVLGVDENVT